MQKLLKKVGTVFKGMKNAISKNIFAHSDIFRFMMHMHTLDVDRKIGDFKPSEERPP